MKKAIVLLAEGFEEVEAITPVDYLRRAGIEVIVAAVGTAHGNLAVRGARGIIVIADIALEELAGQKAACGGAADSGAAVSGSFSAKLPDAVIVPGGLPGAFNIAASKEAAALIGEAAAAGKWVCAICASPAVVLAPLGLLAGKSFTCYPGFEEKVPDGKWEDENVVVDGNAAGGIITSRSAGTAGFFATAIIGQLLGEAEAEKIAKAVLL